MAMIMMLVVLDMCLQKIYLVWRIHKHFWMIYPADIRIHIAYLKTGNNMKKKLIILCSVGFGLLAILSAAILLLSTPKKYLGEWACQNYTDLIDEPNSPNIGFNLNEDGTFIYGQYGDLNNNHYSGSYKAEKANKASQNGEVYYSITFSPTKEFIDDGVKQDTTDLQMDPLEMSVLEKNGKKEATIKFDNLGNIYYCTAAK